MNPGGVGAVGHDRRKRSTGERLSKRPTPKSLPPRGGGRGEGEGRKGGAEKRERLLTRHCNLGPRSHTFPSRWRHGSWLRGKGGDL